MATVSLHKIVEGARACLQGLVDLVLPSVCAACGSREVAADGLCAECGVKLLSLAAAPCCPRCGTGLGPGVPVREDGCFACPDPMPRFARVFRLGAYADPLRSVIHHIKYHRQDGLHRRLGRLLAEAVVAGDLEAPLDLVLPVPMHWLRRLLRGYDHARLLADTIAKELRLPAGGELIRVRHTPPQARLPRTRRTENVRGAFAVTGRAAVEGARVLLVDDVTTTGATADEAARTLLAAGASTVLLAVIAKAEPPRAYAQRKV
jgi:ComF family protein